jgi:type II secretory pathway pseudopilin PulG
MTMIELMVALVVMALLAKMALPAFSEMKRRADAARVVSDLHTIRIAAFDGFAATQTFPPTDAWGVVPAGLAGSLPGGFQFVYKTVTYRWHRWALPDGTPSNPSQPVLLGLDVQTQDVALMAAIRSAYRGGVAFGTPTDATLVIE